MRLPRPRSIPAPLRALLGRPAPDGAGVGRRMRALQGHPPSPSEAGSPVPRGGAAGLRRRADPDRRAEDRGHLLGGQRRRHRHAGRALDRRRGPAREEPPPEPGRRRRGLRTGGDRGARRVRGLLAREVPHQPAAPGDLHPEPHRPGLDALPRHAGVPHLHLGPLHAVGSGRRGLTDMFGTAPSPTPCGPTTASFRRSRRGPSPPSARLRWKPRSRGSTGESTTRSTTTTA